MRKQLILAIAFIAFVTLGISSITKTDNKLKLKDIQLKSTTTDLIQLNLKYDVLNKKLEKELDSKDHNESKIKELEQEKNKLQDEQKRLQAELQAKAKAKTDAQEKLALAASTTAKAYAATGNSAKDYIYGKESGNCPTKWQGEYGGCPAYHGVPTNPDVGYGLCQATPGNKMAVMGAGWETSYELQDQWCSQYAKDRYGGWSGAYAFWLSNKWW